jgi:hypothetical protein
LLLVRDTEGFGCSAELAFERDNVIDGWWGFGDLCIGVACE